MFGNFPSRYIYLVSNLFLLILWLTFYLLRPDLRKKMILVGLLGSPFGPISEFFYARDYWAPQYALGFPWVIEDFLFGFLAGSGASTAYQAFLRRKIGSKKFTEAGLKMILLLGVLDFS